MTAEQVVALHGELEQLAREQDLEPGDRTDRAFSALVALCGHRSDPAAAAVLADPRVGALTGRLRELCAAGEFRLERCWARRVAAAADPAAELAAFPYFANYRDLVGLERHALAGLGAGRPEQVCVLGAGPLPLTALLLARGLGARVDAVDRDPEATELAARVVRAVGGDVRPRTADARDVPGLGDADVVVLAALVGPDPAEKRSVLARVAEQMRPGAVLLARGAQRLRTLLYPPLGADDLTVAGGGLLRPLAEVHPMTDVVNSFVVAARG